MEPRSPIGSLRIPAQSRKSIGDQKDWLKTAVAFANTAPVGYAAIMFVGVKDDGEIEGTANLDKLQRTLSEKLGEAYPAIFYLTRILKHGEKQFLAVLIPGSEYRPHFAGKAFVRDGSQTITASPEQFARLIAERNSKAYEILKWRGKTDHACVVQRFGVVWKKTRLRRSDNYH